MVRVTKESLFYLGMSWFLRFLGSPRLLAGRGRGPGQWVQAPGHRLLGELSWFLRPGGILELFHFSRVKVSLLLGLGNGSTMCVCYKFKYT